MKTTKPENQRPWYEIRDTAADEVEVWIYDEIGDGGFFDEGVAAKDFVRELAAISAPRIALRINSPGGSVFDGQAIYNALVRHPATVTSYVDGVAASIASVVALAGERVVMAANALFMIHDPFGLTMGTAEDMRKMADVLDKVRATIAGVYEERSDLSAEEISAAMADETWYSADEALAAGFADEVTATVDLAACAAFDLGAYRHIPAQLHDLGGEADTSHEQETPAEGAPSPSAEDTPKPRKGRPLVDGHYHKDHPGKESS